MVIAPSVRVKYNLKKNKLRSRSSKKKSGILLNPLKMRASILRRRKVRRGGNKLQKIGNQVRRGGNDSVRDCIHSGGKKEKRKRIRFVGYIRNSSRKGVPHKTVRAPVKEKRIAPCSEKNSTSRSKCPERGKGVNQTRRENNLSDNGGGGERKQKEASVTSRYQRGPPAWGYGRKGGMAKNPRKVKPVSGSVI